MPLINEIVLFLFRIMVILWVWIVFFVLEIQIYETVITSF